MGEAPSKCCCSNNPVVETSDAPPAAVYQHAIDFEEESQMSHLPRVVARPRFGTGTGSEFGSIDVGRRFYPEWASEDNLSSVSIEHPVIRHLQSADAKDCVRFVRLEALPELEVPWPRCQELPGLPVELHRNDLLVAVSHAWPYQAHPDPLGAKRNAVIELVEQAATANSMGGDTLVFFDFLSVFQQPFRPQQDPRTEVENGMFQKALRCMHKIYMYADAIVHIEAEWRPVQGDGELVQVGLESLRGARFRQVGKEVQVEAAPPWAGGGRSPISGYDTVVDVNGLSITSVAELEAALSGGDLREQTARVLKAPFGRQNRTPAGARGWIFFERFLSMVKVAMAPESEVEKVVFANTEETMQQVLEGGRRLRAAAQNGIPQLQELLHEFTVELNAKHFSGTSSDAIAAAGRLLLSDTDRDVVARLMQEAVAALPLRWAEEARAQRDRQIALIKFGQFGRKSVHHALTTALAQEVANGQCILRKTSQGLSRTVSTAALRLARSDGRVFAQLGQWQAGVGKWKMNAKLPSTKIREGEAPSDAIMRVLMEEMAPYAPGLCIGAPQTSITFKESAKYKVTTKYIVNLYEAHREGSAGEPDVLLPRIPDCPSRFGSPTLLSDGEKVFLYAWVEPHLIEDWESNQQAFDEPALVQYQPDDAAQQHARSIWETYSNTLLVGEM